MMGNCCCRKEKSKRKITLLLVGLDNAGKTKTANGLIGDRVTSPVPTVGFSVLNLKYLNHAVKIFDLGGGPNIRAIWNTYFVDAHGLIFVIDSSDTSRFGEVKTVLEDILYSDKISGKPILILANKQDNENSVDEVELIEYLNIEQLVNSRKCPTLVQSCSATEANQNKIDLNIQKGYNWIIGYIIKHYENLNERVERDVREQEFKNKEALLRKIQRIRQQHALEEKRNQDTIETYSDYVKKINGEAKAVKDDEVPQLNLDAGFDYSSSMGSGTVSGSTESFPPVYITSNEFTHLDRPKSAKDFVKNQLKLRDNVQKPPPKPRINKTAPINLYGARHPRSADDRRRQMTFGRSEQQAPNDRRHLRSADNTLFTISNRVADGVGPSGDFIGLKIFDNGSRSSRKTVHRQSSGGDTMSVIDI